MQASFRIGTVVKSRSEELWPVLYWMHSSVRGGALVVGDDDLLHLVYSIAMDLSMVEEVVQFSVGALHRQAAHAVYAAAYLRRGGYIADIPQPHPGRGERHIPDEFAAILLEGATDPVPSPTLRPASPEGMALDAFAGENIARRVAEYLSTPLRPEAGDADDVVFSRENSNDPYGYMLYRLVEDSRVEGYPFRNDPYLLLKMQSLRGEVVVHDSKADALREMNQRLWLAWCNASHNVLGTFCLMESPSGGWYVGGPWVAWPAASLGGLYLNAHTAAKQLYHALIHIADQDASPQVI